MELRKSHWGVDGDRVSLSVPFAKVDRENRLVSGWATLDNVDQADDVVYAAASVDAFKRFQGNIREMHMPIAAGRLVDFREDSFYDSNTQKFYNGIYVTVYVSKGAQDTWEKVLDGTLAGFSIGGNIVESEVEWNKDAGKSIRFIKAYDLVELSLVDSPMNQLSNIDLVMKVFSLTKENDDMVMKGMMAETPINNVFWCHEDEIAKCSNTEHNTCNTCGNSMEVIGWVEESDAEKMQDVVANFLRRKEGNANETGEGGVNMSDEVTKSAEQEQEAAVETDAAAEEEVVTEAPVEEEAKAEESAVVEDVPVEPDFEKMFDNLKSAVEESVTKSKETVDEAVKTVESKVAEVTKAFDDKTSELEKSLTQLSEKLDGIKQEREDVAKRLEVLEASTAIKKSGEVETNQQAGNTLKKGLWSGAFFNDQ